MESSVYSFIKRCGRMNRNSNAKNTAMRTNSKLVWVVINVAISAPNKLKGINRIDSWKTDFQGMSCSRSKDHKAVVLPKRMGNRIVALAISAGIPIESRAGSIRVEPPEATALKKPQTAPRTRPSPINVQSRVITWSATGNTTAVNNQTKEKPSIKTRSQTDHDSAAFENGLNSAAVEGVELHQLKLQQMNDDGAGAVNWWKL